MSAKHTPGPRFIAFEDTPQGRSIHDICDSKLRYARKFWRRFTVAMREGRVSELVVAHAYHGPCRGPNGLSRDGRRFVARGGVVVDFAKAEGRA